MNEVFRFIFFAGGETTIYIQPGSWSIIANPYISCL